MMKLLKLSVVTLLVGFSASSLSAEYYECRDARGHITFSWVPCLDPVLEDGEAQNLWRDMRGLVKKGWKINDALGPTLVSIKQCLADIEDMRHQVSSVREGLESISSQNKNLLFAAHYLEYCSECRVAAESDCDKSYFYLSEAVNDLTSPLRERGF